MAQGLIARSERIVLIVHVNPDADSLGSACAFYSYLLRLQKKVTLYCASSKIDPNLAFLPWFEKITDRFPSDAECMVSFDCAGRSRLGIERELPLINFDHHRSNDRFGTYNVVDEEAISTTEVVYDFFVANDIKINGKMALSLYAGLVDDSQCFRSPLCGARTFETARALLGLGADHALCVEWLYHRRSLASLRVRAALLARMRLFKDGRLAVFEASEELLEKSGASIGECKRVLADALEMRTVQVALLCAERSGGGIRVSLRSDGIVDAAKILSRYNGGGHARRAGARIESTPMADVIDELIMMIQKEIE